MTEVRAKLAQIEAQIAGQVAGGVAPIVEQINTLSVKIVHHDECLHQCQANLGAMYATFGEAMASAPVCAPCGPAAATDGVRGACSPRSIAAAHALQDIAAPAEKATRWARCEPSSGATINVIAYT